MDGRTSIRFRQHLLKSRGARDDGPSFNVSHSGLLIVHRILNPIGTLDDVASSHAYNILLEFLKYLALVGPGTTLPNTVLPILMAGLEIPNIPPETWNSVTLAAVAPACMSKLLALVEYVWMQRDCGSTSFLFDLVDNGADFIIFP